MSENAGEKESSLNSTKLPIESSGSESLMPWQKEVDGIFRAIQYVQKKARGVEGGGFGRDDIFALHKRVMNDPLNPEHTGVLRDVPVTVGIKINGEMKQAAFNPAEPTFLSEFFNEFAEELNEQTQQISRDTSVEDAVNLAARTHRDFIKIHPFRDGNGRTARMLVDYIFRKARLPYIIDWGAANDEYKDVVYRIYAENRIELLQDFLASKLLERIESILRTLGNNSLNDASFVNYLNGRRGEVETLLNLD